MTTLAIWQESKSPMTQLRIIAKATLDDLARCWKSLFITDVIYKLLTLILLGPMISALFRTVIAFSGDAFLSDQDIAFFFLTPIGLPGFLLIGALQLTVVMLGLTSLMVVIADRSDASHHSIVAIRETLRRAREVLSLAGRIIVRLLLTVIPFLVVIGGLYFLLLGEYDINFYLNQRPPEFITAVILALGVVLAMLFDVSRLVLNWFVALPLLIFENTEASKSLKLSQQRVKGHRLTIALGLLSWLLTMIAISTIATSLTVGFSRLLIPEDSESLFQVSVMIGVSLMVGVFLNAVISLLGSSLLATTYFNLFCHICGDESLGSFQPDIANPAEQTGVKITRIRILAVLLIGSLISGVAVASMIGTIENEDRVAIIAHRGASHAAPENTLAAFKQAIEDGADWVELDVQETADGEVVVFHDSDFMKAAGNPNKIWDTTADDLKTIDIGSWFDPKFNDERVPTLGQVLDVCKNRIGVFIELKYYGHDQNLEQRVAEIVEAHAMEDQIVIMSLKHDAVKKMKALRPDWQVGLLLSVSAGNLESLDADFLAINAAFTNPDFVNKVQQQGKRIYVWTVNDAVSMSQQISRGVDGVITDRPELMKQVLKERGEMSIPQRLLLEFSGLLGIDPKIGKQ